MGALHSTGVGGPVNETMRGPDGGAAGLVVVGEELGGTVDGVEVVLAVDVVEAAVDGVVVVGGGLDESLLHAVSRTTAAIVASEASRRRRIRRS